MAGVGDKELAPVGPWPAGIDNLHDETQLKTTDKGVRIALRDAVNMDLSDDGKLKTRGGKTKVVDALNAHSLWHEGVFPYALFVDGGTLYATTFDSNKIAVRTGMAARDVSYELVSDRVYWCNGEQSGIVFADLSHSDWGVESPSGQPDLSVAAAGGLAAGNIQLAITFVRASGEESGTGGANTIDVPDGAGVTLSNIRQPIATDITRVRIYATEPNGDILYFVRDVPVGMHSVTIGQGPLTVPCRTQFLEQMPPGRFVTHLGGKMFTLDRDLCWSESLRYGLRDPRNRIRFGQGTLLKSVGNGTDGAGLYVADQVRTYWLAGPDPLKAPKRIAYPFAAIPGSQIRVPGSKLGLETSDDVAYWVAANGVPCIGLPGGVVKPLNEEFAKAPAASSGASLFREKDGLSQIITALQGGVPQGMAFRDKAAATVSMNGVSL